MQAPPKSAWRIPLVRELAAILLIKLVLLLVIKHIWFDAPTVPPGWHRSGCCPFASPCRHPAFACY